MGLQEAPPVGGRDAWGTCLACGLKLCPTSLKAHEQVAVSDPGDKVER